MKDSNAYVLNPLRDWLTQKEITTGMLVAGESKTLKQEITM
jgi:hypothetical protein